MRLFERGLDRRAQPFDPIGDAVAFERVTGTYVPRFVRYGVKAKCCGHADVGQGIANVHLIREEQHGNVA